MGTYAMKHLSHMHTSSNRHPTTVGTFCSWYDSEDLINDDILGGVDDILDEYFDGAPLPGSGAAGTPFSKGSLLWVVVGVVMAVVGGNLY